MKIVTETAHERDVAESVRAWQRASSGGASSELETAARTLANNLERWIAELLATDTRWTAHGRWHDGLVFVECIAKGVDEFSMRGWIWQVDTQARHPFRVNLRMSDTRILELDVRVAAAVGASAPSGRDLFLTLASSEPDWTFEFVRGEGDSATR